MTAATLEAPVSRDTVTRRRWRDVAVPLGYLLCSVAIFWPMWRTLNSTVTGGPDGELSVWWLRWVPYALAHGHSPLFSSWLNYPSGISGMWNTSMPTYGLLMAPITVTAGPVLSANLLMVLAPAISAWAAYGAGRVLGLSRRSAFLTGLLYGFSAYELGHEGAGHLELVLTAYPPLVLALLYRLLTGADNPRRCGLLLGLLTLLQLGISEEVVASSAIMVGLSLLILAVLNPQRVGRHLPALARMLGWSLVVTVPVMVYPLWVQFRGPARLQHSVHVPRLSTDLLETIVPSYRAAGSFLVPSRWLLTVGGPSYSEVTSYIGLPLVLLVLFSVRRVRRSGFGWVWVPVSVSFVLALGWFVKIGGYNTRVRGPAWLLHELPLLDGLITARLSLYFILACSLLAGVWWDSVRAEPAMITPRIAWAVVALVVIAAVPWPRLHTVAIPTPAAMSDQRPLPGLPDNAVVAVLPWPTTYDATAMHWQSVNNFHFRMLGAYSIVPDANGTGRYGSPLPALNQVATAISHGVPPPPKGTVTAKRVEDQLSALPAQAIVIGTMKHADVLARYLAALLGTRAVLTEGVYVLHLPWR